MPVQPKTDLAELGNGLFAYIQEDGSWGWSNSGLIVSEGQSVMVDTLFTGYLTRDLLDAYRRVAPEAAEIDVLVNTHSNGDHTFGNYVVETARIVASTRCAQEMAERPAEVFSRNIADWRNQGAHWEFLHEVMGARFDFSDIVYTPPNELFDGQKTLMLGGRKLELREFGPAHTRGDIVVHVPDAKTVFVGDLLFSGSHPMIWDGSIANWIRACDEILTWDVDVVVPGHGPVGDKTQLAGMRDYFVDLMEAAQERYSGGQPWQDAAAEIGLSKYDSWLDRERVVGNVAAAYRELSGGAIQPAREAVVTEMIKFHRGGECSHGDECGCHDRKV